MICLCVDVVLRKVRNVIFVLVIVLIVMFVSRRVMILVCLLE